MHVLLDEFVGEEDLGHRCWISRARGLIITPSNALPVFIEFLINFFNPAIRSPRTVQQMQPMFISTMFSTLTSTLRY